MAKFCTKCGKPLQDGKPCDCEEVVEETLEEEEEVVVKKVKTKKTTESSGFDFNQCLTDYIDMVKGMIKAPVDTMKKYATSSNFILGIIAILLNCVVSGVFLYCLIKEGLGLIGGLFGGFSMLSLAGAEIPFMRVFLTGAGFMAAFFATLAVVIYVMAGLVFKDDIDIKKAVALVGVVSVFTTVTTLVNLALLYISAKIMVYVLLIALVFYYTYLGQGIAKTTKVDSNKLALVFIPAIAAALFVVFYVLPKILF